MITPKQGTEHAVSHGNGIPLQADLLTRETLEDQNRVFKGTGGVSDRNRSLGFMPAFQDTHTGTVYLSRFADGRVAPMHLLDGLPNEVVLQRTSAGRVRAVKASLAAGFVSGGRFYTREQAARVVMQ